MTILSDRLVSLRVTPPPPGPRLALALRNAARAYLRTYSDLFVGPITDPALVSTRWWSGCVADGLVGAVVGPMTAFMRDSYTWISLPPPHLHSATIRGVAEAISASSHRCRAVLLLVDTILTREALSMMWIGWTGPPSRRPRHHIMATFGPGTVALSDSLTETLPNSQTTYNHLPLILVLAETPGMPDTDLEGLKDYLVGSCASFSPPPGIGAIPRTTYPLYPQLRLSPHP